MTGWLAVIVLALVLVIIIQIAKAVELVGLIKGEDRAYDNTRLHASLALGFLVVGMIGMVWSLVYFVPRFLPAASSEHGPVIDAQFNITLVLTGIVFIICQIALFWFTYKYREQEGRKAHFYPDNDRLEIVWTIIPAIVMTFLVVKGMDAWYKITGPEPDDAIAIEVTGKQFGWFVRYPGADGKFGAKGPLTLMPLKDDPGGDKNNHLGLDWTDPASRDDIILNKLVIPVDKPVHVRLRSIDVLHSFYLPHMRVKMDVVPGTPTRFWFTATQTTEEMKEQEGPDFKFILACAELCGPSHFSMGADMEVIPLDSFNTWVANERPYYDAVYGSSEPSSIGSASVAQNVDQ